MAKDREIDTFNKWGIGCRGEQLVIMRPPQVFSKEEALLLAAWLATLADLGGEEFPRYLEAVRNT
jgi:hypothetical protein